MELRLRQLSQQVFSFSWGIQNKNELRTSRKGSKCSSLWHQRRRFTIIGRIGATLFYHKLGRHADAEAELAKLKAANGDTAAYLYATIYAQWGHRAKALEWLETALRLRDPGLVQLKADPLLDPLRQEPRFQAIERELKFPS